MSKVYKHKILNYIAKTHSEDCYNYTDEKKTFNMLIGADLIENSTDWEEVIEYPVGTEVQDTYTNYIYTKQADGHWKLPATTIPFTITDKEINKGDRYNVLKKVFSFRFNNHDFYIGDTVYHCYAVNPTIVESYVVTKVANDTRRNPFVYFPTYELAQQYIDDRKKKYSIDDILKAANGLVHSQTKDIADLIKLLRNDKK